MATLTAAALLPLLDQERSASLFRADEGGYLDAVYDLERAGYSVHTIETHSLLLSDLPDASRTTLVLTQIGRPLAGSELEAIVGFVHDGGNLLVSTGDPALNPLLARLGVELDGRFVLADPRGAQPLHSPDGNSFLVGRVTALRAAEQAAAPSNVLLSTANATFLDLDGSRTIDEYDRSGPFVVALQLRIGEGAVIVVGSSEIWENAATDRSLAPWLVARLLPPGGAVVFHEAARVRTAEPFFQASSAMTLATRTPPGALASLLIAPLLVLAPWWYPGPSPLAHKYGGDANQGHKIPLARIADGLRTLLSERARERANLSRADFEALTATQRKTLVEETIQAVMLDDPEASELASLHLMDRSE